MSDRELPPGWSVTPIANLGRIAGGGTPTTSDPRYWQGGTIPWVSPKDMKSLEIADAQDHITPLAVEESSTRLVPRGSVLLVIRSGILQHTLPVGIATREVALNQDMKAIQPYEGLEPRFIAYGLLANQTRILNECCKTGTTVQSIEIPQLKRFQLPLAPTAEQARIADRIDELFTDLAAGMAALERVKRNLSRYRAAVLHAAVTGRLTEAWRKQHGKPEEPGPKLLERILAERRRQWEERTRAKYENAGKQPPKNWRERYPEPSPPKLPADGSPLPELPKGWCWTTLDQLAFVSSGTTPKRDVPAYWQNGSIPWIASTAVNSEFVDEPSELVTDAALAATTLKLYEPGTLLVALYGEGKTRGKVTELRIHATVNQALAAICWFDGSREVKGFVKVALGSMYHALRREAAGGVQPNLNVGLISTTVVPLPPAFEQFAIVEAVNEKLSQIDGLEAEIERGLARASRLRQSILKAAFEGRLVPQDPADEPASVLLERIKQQASEPTPKSNGAGDSANGTGQRRRGRPRGSRKAISETPGVTAVARPSVERRSRKAKAR